MLKSFKIHSENKHCSLCCGCMIRVMLNGMPYIRVPDILSFIVADAIITELLAKKNTTHFSVISIIVMVH